MAIGRSSLGARVRAASLACAMVASIAPCAAHAHEGDAVARLVEVRHGAASRCVRGEPLGDAIVRLAGRQAIAAPDAAADVALAVVFEPLDGGFRATIHAAGTRSGRRVLEDRTDATCASLVDAVAVTAVLLLDAGGLHEPGGVPSATAPVPPLSPPAPPPAAAVAMAPVAPAPSWSPAPGPIPEADDDVVPPGPAMSLGAPTPWAVDGAALFTTAIAARGGMELGAWGRRRLGPASLAVGGRITLPTEHRFANGAVTVWALRSALEGCLDVLARFGATLSPCATLAAGAAIAEGRGFDRSESGALPTLNVGAALVAAFGVSGPVAVLVRGGASGAPVRPAFQVEDDGRAAATEVGEAYRAPAGAIEAGAGLRLAWE